MQHATTWLEHDTTLKQLPKEGVHTNMQNDTVLYLNPCKINSS